MDRRPCPYCAELILENAIVCRFCNRELATGTVTVGPMAPRVPPTTITAHDAQPASPPPPPASKAEVSGSSNGAKIVLLLVLFGVLAALVAARLPSVGLGLSTGSHQVSYSVTGTADKVSLTYTTPGGTEQLADVNLPWNYQMTASSGAHAYVSAQITDQGGGTVTTTILLNGEPVKSATSSGFATIASSSGRVP